MTVRARPTAGRVVDLLDLADRTVGACLARICEAENVTREQWRTLVLLDEGTVADGTDPPGHTMGEIATRAAVPPPTATRLVDKLVADGLAFRRSDPWDRRRVLVHVSLDGHALVERAARSLDATVGAVFEAAEPVDRLDVLDLLRRLAVATAAGPEAVADPTGPPAAGAPVAVSP